MPPCCGYHRKRRRSQKRVVERQSGPQEETEMPLRMLAKKQNRNKVMLIPVPVNHPFPSKTNTRTIKILFLLGMYPWNDQCFQNPSVILSPCLKLLQFCHLVSWNNLELEVKHSRRGNKLPRALSSCLNFPAVFLPHDFPVFFFLLDHHSWFKFHTETSDSSKSYAWSKSPI